MSLLKKEHEAQINPVPHVLYDKDIRQALFDFLDTIYPENRIIEEKEMGRSRADVVLVTFNAIYGIEIKSDQDTYARLERQVKDYDRFFNKNYIVAGTRHAAHIAEHVPLHWGIITVEYAEGKEDFYVLKKPQQNPNFSLKDTLGLLWKNELIHILAKNKMPLYKDKSKQFIRARLLKYVEPKKLHKDICAELMDRDYTLLEKPVQNSRRTVKTVSKKASPKTSVSKNTKKSSFASKKKNTQI